jgi:hypothetical protein
MTQHEQLLNIAVLVKVLSFPKKNSSSRNAEVADKLIKKFENISDKTGVTLKIVILDLK